MGDRKTVLLKACYDMLKKCEQSRVIISPLNTTVFYDDAECDGYCLMEDIDIELGLDDEQPSREWYRERDVEHKIKEAKEK